MIDLKMGILGLIALGFQLYALFNVITSDSSTLKKVLWALALLTLPVLGFVISLLMGPRSRR